MVFRTYQVFIFSSFLKGFIFNFGPGAELNMEEAFPLDVDLSRQQIIPDATATLNELDQYPGMAEFQPFIEDLDLLFGFMQSPTLGASR